MNKYPSMPRQLVDGLPPRNVPHPAGEQVDFHYHDVEEWLEVLKGKISFFSAGELEYSLVEGEALKIPQGEIHRVAIGPEGVTYRMWVPVNDEFFSHMLDDKDMSLVRRNLELPEVENRWDARIRENLTGGDNKNRAFLDDSLSADLTFCTADGKLLVGKVAYLDRPPADVIIRYPSDSIRILLKGPESILLSTVVYTELKKGGPRQSFSNSRLFVKEGDIWKCRVWVNYPELGAS